MSAILLLAPICLDRHTWDQMNLDGEHKYLAHEYPGAGLRSDEAPLDDLDALADDIAGRAVSSYHVVGVSLGGMVAQHLAVRHPGLVRSLLLAATSMVTPTDILLERASAALSGPRSNMTEETLARWFTPASRRDTGHAGIGYARLMLDTASRHAVAAGWRAMAAHDYTDVIAAIDHPVTCVAGDLDTSTPPQQLAAMHERLPRSRLAVLSAAHLLPLDAPNQLRLTMEDHLRWIDD